MNSPYRLKRRYEIVCQTTCLLGLVKEPLPNTVDKKLSYR